MSRPRRMTRVMRRKTQLRKRHGRPERLTKAGEANREASRAREPPRESR